MRKKNNGLADLSPEAVDAFFSIFRDYNLNGLTYVQIREYLEGLQKQAEEIVKKRHAAEVGTTEEVY